MKTKVVVVGNGMVGFRFLDVLTSSAAEEFEIVCFGEEPRPAYDRIHLSEYFSGKSAEELYLADLAWYERRNIKLLTCTGVEKIDRKNKIVKTASGELESYDKLVLATGSAPFMPQLPGMNLGGVFPYRTIEDLEAIVAFGQECSDAVVIGGGLLGLEAAKAMADMKLKTTVVEFAPRLMPRQIDQMGSDLLKRKIQSLGVDTLCSRQTKTILGQETVTGLEFADGEKVDCQMIVVSAGIRPRDELARDAGLKVGERGGIVVDEYLKTSDPDIFAIGECALSGGMIYGLAAPGYRMAESVAKQLKAEDAQAFTGADLSTKLKLMGVDVASIGDSLIESDKANTVVLFDSNSGVYKKLALDPEKRTLKGAILVGDAEDYAQFLQLYLNKIKLPERPEQLLVKGGGGAPVMGVDALPDDALICSCNNVCKKDIVKVVDDGKHKLEEIKTCTSAGTGCGSCLTLVKDILNYRLAKSGIEVDKSLCEHFRYTRQELYEIVKIKQIKTFPELVTNYGKGKGCEICKPTAASIFASLWNEHVMEHQNIQDTNDTYMANIQRNGTYSVVPRVPGGEITPQQLIAIGQVAEEFDLYTKITGGQRIDLFGAQLEDLPVIWEKLIAAGLESGHAYAKAVRTVKSCVGSTWCRFGVQDSTTMAIDLELRYRGLRSPHKLKFGVSGCARECAEAQGKDVGVIATEKGWNLYVCGNGGMKPQHAVLLARDVDTKTLFTYVDRFLIYYIRTADRLQRTATWLNNLEGGIEKVKKVVIEDSLGVAADMDKEMQDLVDGYQDEWATTLNNPEKLKRFKSFVNTDERDPTVQFVQIRGQKQPQLVSQD